MVGSRSGKAGVAAVAAMGLMSLSLAFAAAPTASGADAVSAPVYQWPEAHQNPQVTGVSADPKINQSNAASLGLKWMTFTGGEILSSPVVAYSATLAKTVVYVGNDAGYMMAFDQATGIPLWSVNLGGSIRSVPLVEDGNVWVAPTSGGRAFKLNAASGATECSAPVQNASGETVDASPVIATPPGGVTTVYFAENDTGDFNGPVTALKESDCSVEFQSTPEPKAGAGGVWDFLSYAVSATGEGLVLFGTADPDGATYAIDAETGKEVWRFQAENPAPYTYDVGAGLTVSNPGINGFKDGVVYFPNKYGIMYALDLTTGKEIWSYNFGAQTGLEPTGSLDTAALSGTNLVWGDTGGVWDLNAVTGTKVWYHSNGPYGEVDGAPAIIGPAGQRVVVVSDLTGSVIVLSLADGSQLYTYQTGAFSVGSPADVDGNIIDTSGSGFLYDFAPGGATATAPTTAVSVPTNQSTIPNPDGTVSLSGTASGSSPITSVAVSIQKDGSGGTWWDGASGSWVDSPFPNVATLTDPGSDSTNWSASFPTPPAGGGYEVFASAVSNGVADPSIGLSAPTAARSSFTVSPSSTATRFVAPLPWVGPAGPIQVQGSGFAPKESVAISLDGKTLATVKASPTGAISSTNVVIPSTALFGPAELDATGETSGDLGVAPIYVTNNWSQLGFNSLHAATDPNDTVLGHHLSISPQTFLTPAWSFNAGAPVAGSMIVDDGLGYFADQSGEVFALSMATGMPQWTYEIPGGHPVVATPAVTQTALVLVASVDGTVYALHQFSGALAWQTKIGGQLEGSPSVVGGTAYVGSNNGTVAAIDVSTGSIIWSSNFGTKVRTSPAVDPAAGLVFVGDSKGKVTALNSTTGSLVWQSSVPGRVVAAIVIGQGQLYVGSLNDTLYALSERSGSQVWTYQAGGPISASVADDQDQIVVGDGSGQIHYLSPATGKPQYAITLGQPVVGVAGSANFIASLGARGDILGSKPAATNPHAWAATQGTALSSQPTVVNGEVVITAGNGMVDVYTPPGSPAY